LGCFKSGRGLYVGVRTLPYLRSKHTNPLSYTSYDPFSVIFFSKNKAKRWVTFSKMWGPTWLLPHPRPLILGMPPTILGLYHSHKAFVGNLPLYLDIPLPPHQRKTQFVSQLIACTPSTIQKKKRFILERERPTPTSLV
jgi:hypothetical protein